MKRFYLLLINLLFYTVSFSTNIVYVSSHGNDNYEGTISKPFKSIRRALKYASIHSDSIVIYIREGIYSMNESLIISDLKNVILTSFPNEKVYITGGILIDNKYINKLKSQDIFSRINKDIQKKIKKINFDDFGIKITDLDKRGFEYPSKPAWNEIFINDKPLKLAQWPNDEMIVTHKVINTGNNKSKGILGKGNPIIEYVEDEPNTWKDITGAWICGYFGEGWADDMLPIKEIDNEKKTITIGGSSLYGFKADGFHRRWFIRNLPELIDLHGEYVNNSICNEIFFLPPKEKIKKIQLSTLTDPIISIHSCENISIKNITIECSRGIGIHIESSNKILIDSCVIRNIGNLGIKIGSNTYNNGIQNSYIYNIGAGGIELNGGNRKQLISGNNFVHNCRIHNFNRIEKAKRPAVNLKGAGNKISNVEIYDAPSMGIYLNGNNHTIEYVNIHNVCKEMHDCGAIYYGRNPTERGHQIKYSYFHDIKSPYALTAIYHDDGACGMEVYGCIFNNVSSAPVLIGGGQDITYKNNIFMNLPYAIQIDNRLQIWQSYSKWLKPNGEYDTKFKAVNYTQPPYSTAYPELLEYWENNPALPKRNIITNNIFYNVNHLVKGNPAFLVLKDNFETKNNPGFKDIKSPMKGLNYKSVRNNLPNFTPIPFEEIGCSLPIIQ